MDYERITAMLHKTFAWSVSRTYSREEAEELTQETMYQALKSIGGLRDDSRFEPWFWRLADITLKAFKRGKGKDKNIMSFDEVSMPLVEDEYSFEMDNEYQNLRRKIAQMSAAYRDIIVMHYYDNLSCKTISQKLGLPEGTVTYRLSMARNKLKEESSQMNETALKPAQLKIRITGDGNYNGDTIPFPWMYINDALSQNILWYAYREPKTVEDLSKATGVPAYFIEDRIKNLVKREAVIQPTKTTVQTGFLIFDEAICAYAPENAGKFVAVVSERFYELSGRITEKVLSAGLNAAGRAFDEIQCLLSVMLLDKTVPEYAPSTYTQIPQKYDGGRWDYTGFMQNNPYASDVGIGMEKSMNNYESGKLAHFSYHFAPFEYRKMMFSHEIDVCHAVIQREPLKEKQIEHAAKLIAEGYLAKNENGEIVCDVPVFTKKQHDLFITLIKEIFAEFLPFYSEQVKKYLDGYMKLFPKHLKEQVGRNGFHVFVALFKAVTADWIKNGKINISADAVCDALIMM